MDPWLRRWLFTTNHKDIGILYFISALYFGFVGAILAIFMRVQLSVPLNNFLGAAAFDQAVTLHGLIMILWFLSPLAIAFMNYMMPLQIGATDMAMPRLNALGYWLFVFGGILATLGFFLPGGNASGGWTTYVPLSTSYTPGPGPTLAFLGLIMLVVSITIGSVNILLTITYMRAPGMTWRKIPMFTWFVLFTILQMLFSFPSLLAALLMLVSDRVLGTVIFSLPVSQGVAAGGSVLWDDVFWFFGHPEVYVVLLPGFGIDLGDTSGLLGPSDRREEHHPRGHRGRHRPAELPGLGAPHVHHGCQPDRGRGVQRRDPLRSRSRST